MFKERETRWQPWLSQENKNHCNSKKAMSQCQNNKVRKTEKESQAKQNQLALYVCARDTRSSRVRVLNAKKKEKCRRAH